MSTGPPVEISCCSFVEGSSVMCQCCHVVIMCVVGDCSMVWVKVDLVFVDFCFLLILCCMMVTL